MTEVISIRFRGKGKAYFFASNGIHAKPGDKLVVETSKGMELGECAEGNHMVEDNAVVQPLRPVIRAATADDRRVEEINRQREAEAFEICRKKIAEHGLEMKLVDVECSFEGNKILFFFTADGRVDFRELVKDLAGVFRTRIELRQIGVRDEAKMLGGLGICGRPFCCHDFLDDFQPVSTKMAKTQSMSLNPVKISGICGRLMCCLRYEQEAYEDLVKHVPKNGAFVQTADGYGNVTLVNLLRQNVKVQLDGTGDPVLHTYSVDDIAEVPGGRPPEGQPLPNVLKAKPRTTPAEKPAEDRWIMPRMLADEPVPEEKETPEKGSETWEENRPRRNRNGKGKAAPAESRSETPEKTRTEGERRRNHRRSGQRAPKPTPEAAKPEHNARPAGEGQAANRPKNNHRNHHRRKGNGGAPKAE